MKKFIITATDLEAMEVVEQEFTTEVEAMTAMVEHVASGQFFDVLIRQYCHDFHLGWSRLDGWFKPQSNGMPEGR